MNDRIKFSGHTMGAPKCDIFEVIELFKSIGYDGIEVRVAADGQIDSEKLTDEEALKIDAAARAKGMEFSCLNSSLLSVKKLFTSDSIPSVILSLKKPRVSFPAAVRVYCVLE